MSETPINPERQGEHKLSEETLIELQGLVNRMVIEDTDRKDLGRGHERADIGGGALLATFTKVSEGIRETAVIRWNKDLHDGKPNPTHALVRLAVGPHDNVGSQELYSVGVAPELCWYEYDLGGQSYRLPIDEAAAQGLILKLRSFMPDRTE